ncbi:MAG TPA: UDP-N-acetylenolpyruvoylglucosamine reductase, partial [bacterium]
SVCILDESKKRELHKKNLKFSYRSVNISKATPAISCVIRLKKDAKEGVISRVRKILDYRNSTQPHSLPSAGCIFKNPQKISAGRLIDDLGLKGVRVRGAMISEKHANFIVNIGNATAKDVITLMELVKDKVKEERNLFLEPEIVILGEE